MCDYTLIRGLQPMVRSDGQGHRKKHDGKFMTKRSVEEVCV